MKSLHQLKGIFPSQAMWLYPVAPGGGVPIWKSPHSVSLFLILADASGLVPFQREDNGMRGKGMESEYLRTVYQLLY